MTRRVVLNFLTALSLLLCVAVCVLWVRSSQVSMRVCWNSIVLEPTSQFRTDSVISDSGRIGFTRLDTSLLDDRPQFQLFMSPAREFPITHASDDRGLAWGLYRNSTNDSQTNLNQLEFLGFCLIASKDADQEVPAAQRLQLWLPYWFVTAALAAPAATRLVVRYRNRRRFGAGLCPQCGYDLRATPGRCPVCGRLSTGAQT